jgi:hypothetical protein
VQFALPFLILSSMKKKLNLLLKRLKIYAGLKTKAKSAQFLLLVFNDTQFFKLPEKQQKVILENLLSYFDTLILGFETPKKQNKHFSFLDIQNHIKNKVIDMCNYPSPKY